MELIKEVAENHNSEKIKLSRGQRGGYGWEITILSLDIDRLETLNKKMLYTFGGESVEVEE